MDQSLRNIRGILFDLDGTLLQMMEDFIPAYIAKLAACFADMAPQRKFCKVVRSATFTLLTSGRRGRSNKELFLADVERRLGIAPEQFGDRLRRFYDDGMADLEGLIRPLPLARNILQRCFDRGLKVAIATNPVFPRPLVEARLAWGGIGDFPYHLVTSFENSRYCKPDPRYFRQVLAELELEPEETVMVGNDTEHDLGARAAGIATFLVDTWLVDRLDGCFAADFRGGHPDLFRFVGRLGNSQ